MKKILSVILSVAMLFGICTALSVSAEPIGWEVHEDVDLRVGILTDTHMRNADTTSDIVNHILDSQAEIAGGKMDGMALIGDVVFYNTEDDCSDRRHYRNIYASIEEKMPGAEVIYAMGNHEFPFGVYDDATSALAHNAFVEGTGQSLNAHKIIGDGYHFIAMAPKSATSELTAETKAWAMQEIENAIGSDSTNGVQDENGNYSFPEGTVPDSTKPVFLMAHATLPGTVLWGTEGGNVTELVAYLKTRPQVVVLQGHQHVAAQIPSTIWQDGFTSFQGSINDGHYVHDNAFTAVDTSGAAYRHHGAMLEVDDGVVKLYKLDYDYNEEIGEPWVIDIPQIVANLRDENPNNDKDAFLYTEDKRANTGSTAQFPQGTELTVYALVNGASVTFPNTAYMSQFDPIQQDNFVRGYKVEAVNASGIVVAKNSYGADYYLKPEERKKTYTLELSGLEGGQTYTINVYPVMPLGLYGTLGTPVSAEITMPEDETKEDAIRYEIEDYCPETKLNKESVYASGGGICISSQGGLVPGSTALARPADDTSPFTFDFEVELPIDGTYNIEYGVGYRSSGYLSKVSLTLDDTIVIGDNMAKGDIDRSLDSTYPWEAHIPLYTYFGNSYHLTAGKHKVTVTVDLPETTTMKQPYLFCADYIEFNPATAIVGLNRKGRIELEEYASNLSIEETDGIPGTASVVSWANCGGGAYMAVDTVDNLAVNDYESFTIPMYVEHEGYYQMSFVECSAISQTDIFLDSIDGTQLNKDMSIVLDTETDAEGNYTYFKPGWARMQIGTKKVYLSEGNHELIVRIKNRGGKFNDFAAYLDYVEFKPITKLIEKEEEFLIEFENYKADFNGNPPEVRWYEEAHGGAFVASGGAGKETVVLNIPVYVEEDGTYFVDASIGQAAQLSAVTLLKDGAEELYSFTLENATRHLFSETHYVLREYKFSLELTKGLQTLTFSMAPRNGWEGTIAYALDYFRIAPDTDGVVEADKVTTVEFENVVKRIDKIEQSDGSVIVNGNGTNYVPAVWDSLNCSGGKYVALDTPDGQGVDSYYDIPVRIHVKKAGTYRMKYVVSGNLGAPGVFLDDDSKSIAVPRVKTDDSKNESGLFDYFNSSWSNVGFHEGTVYLPEGLHTIYFRTNMRGGKFLDYAQNFDFVEFSPVESFRVANGTASVTAVTDRPVTGTAILALYNGSRMIGVGSVPMTNAKLVEITVPVNETVTSAKVMTWGDFTTAKPIEAEKVFTAN